MRLAVILWLAALLLLVGGLLSLLLLNHIIWVELA